MGAFVKLIDAMLFLYFLLIVVQVLVLDAQFCFPEEMFPSAFVNLKKWYIREYKDYIMDELPGFFVGLIWIELILQWPLALLSLYAILASKSWYNTTSLMYGVSAFTAMGSIVGDMELYTNTKATTTLKIIYYPYMGFSALAILRGLMPQTKKTISPELARRKMA